MVTQMGLNVTLCVHCLSYLLTPFRFRFPLQECNYGTKKGWAHSVNCTILNRIEHICQMIYWYEHKARIWTEVVTALHETTIQHSDSGHYIKKMNITVILWAKGHNHNLQNRSEVPTIKPNTGIVNFQVSVTALHDTTIQHWDSGHYKKN